MLDAACSTSHDDCSDKYRVDNICAANTKPAVDAVVCREHKPKVQFVVPIKRKAVNVRNDGLRSDEHGVHVNVARPVVMPTLSHTQSFTDKSLSMLNNSNLSDLQSIRTTSDTGSMYELLPSSPECRRSVAESLQSEEEGSVVMDTADDCVVTNNSLKTLLTVSAGDVLDAPQRQRQTSPAADWNDLSVSSQSFDIGEHSHSRMNYLSEKVEQQSALAFTNDSVSTLVRKDHVSKQTVDTSKRMISRASPGSLSMSRKSGISNKVSLKDAVDGTRPHTYPLLEVTFTIDNINI